MAYRFRAPTEYVTYRFTDAALAPWEAERNTDPGADNVRLAEEYLIAGASLTGTYVGTGEPPEAPAAPTITAANDGTGTSVTVTVTGAAGATHQLYYRATTATAWTTGLTRVGNGTIQQTSLTNNTRYEFVVQSSAGGALSVPSAPAFLLVTDNSADPAGWITGPLGMLRSMIAASSAFQAWTTSADATDALAYVHRVATQKGSTPTTACAIVDWADNLGRDAESGGLRTYFVPRGDLMLWFRAPITAGQTEGAAANTFLADVEEIVLDIEQLAGTAGYLAIMAIEREFGPTRPTDDEAKTLGDYYLMGWRVQFGA